MWCLQQFAPLKAQNGASVSAFGRGWRAFSRCVCCTSENGTTERRASSTPHCFKPCSCVLPEPFPLFFFFLLFFYLAWVSNNLLAVSKKKKSPLKHKVPGIYVMHCVHENAWMQITDGSVEASTYHDTLCRALLCTFNDSEIWEIVCLPCQNNEISYFPWKTLKITRHLMGMELIAFSSLIHL